MKDNTCMVTGHRKIDPAKTEFVQQAIRREILAAIDDGCTHFISGFDQGVGLIFAKRNRNMVQLSTHVIAVYDGRVNGSTYDTIRCVHAEEKDIHLITI